MLLDIINTKSLFNPFANYTNKGVLDLDKSYFEILPTQSLTAGDTFYIKVSLVDRLYQKVNITSNQTALGNLIVTMVLNG